MADNIKYPEAKASDIFLVRDGEGKLEPMEATSPFLARTVRFLPITYGYIKRHGLDLKVTAVDWPTEKKLHMLKTHFVTPDLSEVSVKDIEENTDPLTIDHMVALLVSHSIPTHRLRATAPGVAEAAKSMAAVILQNALRTRNTGSTESDTDIPGEKISTS